ncbi:MGMT family protein [Salinimonas sediminis]|uniref:Cysteine methyltransferase n=1 Tax=Salinimonas sediminis TaxID=2303538 RepID=A0A346NHA5_9ALTE|nr:MGMT family protein [Salinimonas sediminis]AXR04912.1 cysteine methyltransferase [Salinimonas sediminis]
MPNCNRYHQIFAVVRLVPSGKVAAYGQIADLAGLPGRARLVGKALGYPPAGSVIPWHRIVRANGQIAFPPGSQKACEQREKLLLEGVEITGNRVRIKQYGWRPELHTLLHELSS